ncbi:MAG TPA: transposase [Thermoanaerobaculia bacterium]|nr:transposase [Thermoanaerobaculia bacterium]
MRIRPSIRGDHRFVYNDVVVRKRSTLPHWDVRDGIYFITICLANAFPQSMDETLAAFRHARDGADDPRREELLQQLESSLDEGHGSCWLARPDLATLVSTALKHFDGARYRLGSYSVMPNHVHAVYRSMPQWPLSSVMHSWKSFTSKEANRLLNRTGQFWQEDYFDRLMRTRRELEQTTQYVMNNPAAAGLVDWKWVESFGVERLLSGEGGA